MEKTVNITIYIDESGDFESSKGNWIISGFICFDNYKNSIKILDNYCKALPQQFGFPSIENFHLTEIRRTNYSLTHKVATELFQKVLCIPELKGSLISVVNESKTRVSERERTYRLMLLDLIAFAEASVGNMGKIDSLDLIIATRTDMNYQRMTTQNQIEQTIADNLKIGLEEGLISKGLIEINNNKCLSLIMESATKNWGLIVADFISNIIYNRNRTEDRNIIDNLIRTNFLKIFVSCGNFDERRARIATRDKQYTTALSRWLELASTKNNGNVICEIKSIIFELIGKPNVKLLEATIEGVIERIWRQYSEEKKYSNIYKILSPIVEILRDIIDSGGNKYSNLHPITFRLNNILLQCFNHTGNTSGAENLTLQQNTALLKIYDDPGNISMIMDYYLYEIDYLFNDFKLINCFDKSLKYFEFAKNYFDLWEMIKGDPFEYKKSRLYVRAEMNLIKFRLYNSAILNSTEAENILKEIWELKPFIENIKDYHRLLGLEILAHIKSQTPEEILTIWGSFSQEYLNEFDIYIILRAINDTLLKTGAEKVTRFAEIIPVLEVRKSLYKKGHPNDLIMREFALYYALNKQKKAAEEYIAKSIEKLNELNNNCHLIEWLKLLTKCHKEYTVREKIDSTNLLSFLNKYHMTEHQNSLLKSEGSLRLARIISPF